MMNASPANAAGIALHEAYADLPAGRIFYRDSGGSGPAVLFLHPASGNSAIFENQVDAVVKAGFRFVAYDRAGAGRSTRAATAGGVAGSEGTPEIEQLLDHLHIDRSHLVGSAAGGGVALEYVLRRPARVLSLTVANSIGNVQDAAYGEMSASLRPPAFNALPPELRELGPSYRAANPDGVARWLSLNGEVAGLAGGPPSPGGAGPAGGVTFAALERLRIPTLLLTGDADLYTPPHVLRLFKAHMKQADMYVIPDSGHAAHWENPAEFNRRVIAFLRRHRGG